LFQPAKASIRRGPERAVRINPQIIDAALGEPFRRTEGLTDLPVLEIRNAPLRESKPQAALRRICGQSRHEIVLTKIRPRNLSDLRIGRETEEAKVIVREPEIALFVRNHRINKTARQSRYWNESIVLQITETVQC